MSISEFLLAYQTPDLVVTMVEMTSADAAESASGAKKPYSELSPIGELMYYRMSKTTAEEILPSDYNVEEDLRPYEVLQNKLAAAYETCGFFGTCKYRFIIEGSTLNVK